MKFGDKEAKSLRIGRFGVARAYLGDHKVFEDLDVKLGRGLAFSKSLSPINLARDKHCTWCYNWNWNASDADIASMEANGVTFVPMVWGKTFDKESIKNFIKSHKGIKFLLAFNEPSMVTQSWVTPREAATLWPQLEEIASDCGLRLVSPAMCFSADNMEEDGVNLNNPTDWLDKFFADYSSMHGREPRVDFIACHVYDDESSEVMSQIAMYAKYGRKIWLTEFNRCDWGSTNPNGTIDDQLGFMRDILPKLDSDPNVFAYAWFFANAGSDAVYSLYKNSLTTELGKIYVGG